MKIPTRATLPFLAAAALLAAGCDDEAEGPIPEGVSVEPTDEPFATGGVSLPANVTADTAQPATGDTVQPAADTPPR